MSINDMADQMVTLLAGAATTPGTASPYMTQADLMAALRVSSQHTMCDIATRAAKDRVRILYSGYAVLHNEAEGYRLGDRATIRDIKMQRRKLSTARTILLRLSVVLLANSNGQLLKMVGGQIQAMVTTIIDPALASIDTLV